MDESIFKEVLDQLFAKHPEVADCVAHRRAVASLHDGVNFDVASFEAVLKALVGSGAILSKPTQQQEQEAQWKREKELRAQASADADYIRRLKRMTPEEGVKEMKRLRAAEAAGQVKSPLLQKTAEELKAIIRAEEAAKKSKGIRELPWQYRLHYSPNITVTLDSAGIRGLDRDEYRRLLQVFGAPEVTKALNERVASTQGA